MKALSKLFPYSLILLLILSATIGLIWADYETTSWNLALAPENLINGFVFYTLPAILLSFFIFYKIKTNLGNPLAIVVSLVLSIPITFVVIAFGLKIFSIVLRS
ncbi:MAG: hypothetical protein B7C24_04170 [Bacteroidetes bacterium 4572_77]|nr:MAG: hypothetical protein B7C24_04170 [Bacteroidetes bacterium 4572_77]